MTTIPHSLSRLGFLPDGYNPARWVGPTAWQPERLFSLARRAYSVLVVDDDRAKRYAIVRALRAAGFGVGEAPTGADALVAFPIYSAVVLDVHLPDVDGFELCRQIRGLSPLLPIVQVSSVLVDPEYRHAGRDAGADAYLPDPELTVLIATVDRLLGIDAAGTPPDA